MVAAIRVSASVLTDKAKVPTFLPLCGHCKPEVVYEVVPKMEDQETDDADLLTGLGRVAHSVLYYAKPVTKTLGCLFWF